MSSNKKSVSFTDSSALGGDDKAAAIKDTQTESKGEDFWGMVSGIVSAIPYKMAILIFIVFVLINSTIFIEYFVEPLGKNYYDAGSLTNTGTYLQGLFLVIGYMLMHALVSNDVL